MEDVTRRWQAKGKVVIALAMRLKRITKLMIKKRKIRN